MIKGYDLIGCDNLVYWLFKWEFGDDLLFWCSVIGFFNIVFFNMLFLENGVFIVVMVGIFVFCGFVFWSIVVWCEFICSCVRVSFWVG